MSKKFSLEIDLEDILYEVVNCNGSPEYEPSETLQESIQRQVKAQIIDEIKNSYLKEFKEYLYKDLIVDIRSECLKEAKIKIPSIIEDAITREYEVTNSWGSKSKTTCFLNEYVRILNENMTYKKCNYDSDKNHFSKMVDDAVKDLYTEWKSDFDKHIKEEVLSEAYRYALEKVAKAFQLNAKELESEV